MLKFQWNVEVIGLFGFVPVNLNFVTVLLQAKSHEKSAFGLGSTVIVFVIVSFGLQLSLVMRERVEVRFKMFEVRFKMFDVEISLPFNTQL